MERELILWIVIAALAIVTVTRLTTWPRLYVLALAQDGLPLLLTMSWVVLAVAALQRSWVLVIAAGVLCCVHLTIIVPRLLARRVPRWAIVAPTVELLVANVFIDNETPEDLVGELLASDADVIVLMEWNERFAAAFESADGHRRYPHRLCDETDRSEYSVCIMSRHDFGPDNEMVAAGPLTLARVCVPCGDRFLHVHACHPVAVLNNDDYSKWCAQLDVLATLVPKLPQPFVIAGDLNSSAFRAPFRRLLRAGVVDAHNALGRGLSASFKLAASGVLATPGAVVRLDHALLGRDVVALQAKNLAPGGSDHLPFRVTLAVRQLAPGPGGAVSRHPEEPIDPRVRPRAERQTRSRRTDRSRSDTPTTRTP